MNLFYRVKILHHYYLIVVQIHPYHNNLSDINIICTPIVKIQKLGPADATCGVTKYTLVFLHPVASHSLSTIFFYTIYMSFSTFLYTIIYLLAIIYIFVQPLQKSRLFFPQHRAGLSTS
jgi:hypothetical protein